MCEKQNNKIKSKFSLVFLLFPFIRPQYFSQIPIILNIYYVMSAFVFLIVFFAFLKQKNKSKISIIYFMIIIYMFLVTFLKEASIKYFVSTFLPITALVCIFEMNVRDNFENLCSALVLILVIFMIINLFTIIFKPNGLYNVITFNGTIYKCWFFGYKNPQIRMILPILLFSLLNYKQNNSKFNKKIFYLSMIMAWLTILLVKSATGLLSLFIFTFILITSKAKKISKMLLKINLSHILIATFIIILLIVYFNFQNMFSFLIEGILKKDLDLTDRISIWILSLNRIKDSLLFGYGFQSSTQFSSYIIGSHPHNYILYNLYNFGVICMGLILYMWNIAYKTMKNSNQNPLAIYFYITLLSFLVIGIPESLTETLFLYPLLIMCYNLFFYEKRGKVV